MKKPNILPGQVAINGGSYSIKADRLYSVDALRGFAALYVLVYHVVLMPDPKLSLPPWVHPLILNGDSGVTLFFVISAFTLCYTLRARNWETRLTLKFYLRRFFRIVPLYYTWLVFMALRAWGLSDVLHHKRELIIYLGFGFNFVPGLQQGLVLLSWTLGVEMVFYLLFPLVFRLVNTMGKALVLLGFCLLIARAHFLLIQSSSSSNVAWHQFYFSFFHQLPVFAVGILAYFGYERIKRCQQVPKTWGILLIVCSLVGLFLLPYVFVEQLLIPKAYAMGGIYAFLLLGLTICPTALVVNRFTVFYGTISYSLYLNHPLLVYYFTPVYKYIYSLNYGRTVLLVASLIITLLPLTLLSYLTYRLIEQRGIYLGSRLIKQFIIQNSKAEVV